MLITLLRNFIRKKEGNQLCGMMFLFLTQGFITLHTWSHSFLLALLSLVRTLVSIYNKDTFTDVLLLNRRNKERKCSSQGSHLRDSDKVLEIQFCLLKDNMWLLRPPTSWHWEIVFLLHASLHTLKTKPENNGKERQKKKKIGKFKRKGHEVWKHVFQRLTFVQNKWSEMTFATINRNNTD